MLRAKVVPWVSRGVWMIGLMGLAAANAAGAELTTIHMDEVPSQAVHGMHLEGVGYSFNVGGQASSDAMINAFGVGTLVYVDDPSLEGTTAGHLDLEFDRDVTYLSFGVALQSEADVDQAVHVSLLDSSRSVVFERWLNTSPLAVFSEAQFVYEGADAFRFAEISFASDAPRFVMDNLSYLFREASPVPEPSGWLLSLVGGPLLLAACARRHRSA